MKAFKMVMDVVSKAYEALIPDEEEAKRLGNHYLKMYGFGHNGRNTG